MFAAIARPFSAIVSSLRPKKGTKTDGGAESRADAPKARSLIRRNPETRPFDRLPESLPAVEPGPTSAKAEPSAVLAMLLRPYELSNEATKSDSPSASARAQTLAAPQLPTTRPAEMVRPEASMNGGGPVQGKLVRALKAQTPVTPAVAAYPLPALPVLMRPTEHGGVKISTDATDTTGKPRASILADKPPIRRSVLDHPLPALPVSLRPTEHGGVKINMDTPPSPTNKPRAPILKHQNPCPVSVHPLPALPAKISTDTSDKHGTSILDHQTPTRPSVMAHPFFALAMSLRPIEPTNRDAKKYMNAPPPARVRVPQAHKAQTSPTRFATMANPPPVLPASLGLQEPTNGDAALGRWRGPANRNEISTDTPPAVGTKDTQNLKSQIPATGLATANPFTMPQHPIEPTDGGDEICRDAIAYVETNPSQIRKVQVPGTPPARPSVMEHPFFALAMSLRPIGSDEDTSESAYSPSTHIGKPKDRTPEPKSPVRPAVMARPLPEPTVPLHRKENTNGVEASTQIPDALPRALSPQKPDLRGLKRPNHNTITPGSTPEHPAAQYLLGEEVQGRKCPQCPPSRRPFGTQVALQMHLASGYHGRESKDLTQPSSNDHPETSPRTSSRSTSRQSDNDPATPPPQGATPSRVSTRDIPVSTFASTLIQQISAALSGTTRVTILDHLLQGIDTDLPETQSTRSPPPSFLC